MRTYVSFKALDLFPQGIMLCKHPVPLLIHLSKLFSEHLHLLHRGVPLLVPHDLDTLELLDRIYYLPLKLLNRIRREGSMTFG